MIWIGLVLGLPASYLFWLLTSGKVELMPALIWLPVIIVGGMLFQSLFYIAAFIELFYHPAWKKVLSLFAPVGKMALTNYLVQTIFYLLIFFHWPHGLQLYGKLSLTETYLIAIVLFVIQVFLSRWWLRSHEQGPVDMFGKKWRIG